MAEQTIAGFAGLALAAHCAQLTVDRNFKVSLYIILWQVDFATVNN